MISYHVKEGARMTIEEATKIVSDIFPDATVTHAETEFSASWVFDYNEIDLGIDIVEENFQKFRDLVFSFDRTRLVFQKKRYAYLSLLMTNKQFFEREIQPGFNIRRRDFPIETEEQVFQNIDKEIFIRAAGVLHDQAEERRRQLPENSVVDFDKLSRWNQLKDFARRVFWNYTIEVKEPTKKFDDGFGYVTCSKGISDQAVMEFDNLEFYDLLKLSSDGFSIECRYEDGFFIIEFSVGVTNVYK